jgi:disease resistance protein RPM1
MTVLELDGLPIVEIPYAIGDLFNLRHLGLRNSKVKMLPKSVEKLSNLLTLDLSRSCINELSEIVKLKKLRHLFAQKWNVPSAGLKSCSCSGVSISKDLGNLTNLQTLQALVAEDESVRQLGELKQLRSLRLLNVKTNYCRSVCESLVQMQFLSFLDVYASDENAVLRLNTLPSNLQKLYLHGQLDKEALQSVGQNLYVLGLVWSRLVEDPLLSLYRLTNLTELYFTNAYNGEQLVFRKEWFPNLKTLLLKDLPHLKRLEIEEDAMVTLEKLYLINLNSMTEVPLSIKFLVTLQHLGFYEITRDFLTLLCQCPKIGGMRQFWHTLRA